MVIPTVIYHDENNNDARDMRDDILAEGKVSLVSKSRDAKMLIAIGGDGTLIRAIQTFNPTDGLNVGLIGMGTVNYLAMGDEPVPDNIHLLKYEIDDDYIGIAMNEISVKSLYGSMVKLDMYIDDELVYENMRGDGIIISTSVGSTAYSMSAGGPIVDIGVPVNIIVPNNEYSRHSRPIVVSNDKTIKLVMHTDYEIWADGSEYSQGVEDEEIIITKGNTLVLWHANTLVREEKRR